jgi:hypothetical protein
MRHFVGLGGTVRAGRTSHISSPADGKIPALTDDGKRAEAVRARGRGRAPEGPEDLTERFTRVCPEILNYEFTLDDPKSFTKPWTAMIPTTKLDEPFYEYACHEGNHALEGMLAGAREDEKKK